MGEGGVCGNGLILMSWWGSVGQWGCRDGVWWVVGDVVMVLVGRWWWFGGDFVVMGWWFGESVVVGWL
jgi:hypothetical protein